MKTLFKILILLAAAGYLCFAIIRFSHHDENAVCEGLYITLEDSTEMAPIDTGYVHELLVRNKFFPEGQLIDDIPLAVIDSVLTSSPYIKSSLVYIGTDRKLCIEVVPHIPMMHVMPDGAPAYYLATDGEAMPANGHHYDLPLASGHISQSFAATRLARLAHIMAEDSFWDDQIGQIYVERDSSVVLIPRVGDITIRLGKLNNLRSKLNHIRTFYSEALPQVGWNIYSEINLEYDNQIIATRKRIK